MSSNYINFGANGISSNATYFMFAGKPIPWENESVPDPIDTSVSGISYNTFDDITFAKYIPSTNMNLMTDRHDWASGTIYTQYDDQDINLASKVFFVITSENGNYNVWKCLSNNNGSPSTAQPLFSQTSEGAEYYATVDGYQWKYLYTIQSGYYNTFTTSTSIPVLPNSNVASFASNGGIETIIVASGGNNYNSYANGFFSSIQVSGNSQLYGIKAGSISANNNFYTGSTIYIQSGTGAGQTQLITNYVITGNSNIITVNSPFTTTPDFTSSFYISPSVNIVGDGSGASAISVINPSSNSVSSIEIILRGTGYTYANTSVTGNTGFSNSTFTTPATIRAIISPIGGHGSNVVSELNVTDVGFSASFLTTENGQIPANTTYRKIGIISNPVFANVTLQISPISGSFEPNETVTQYSSNNSIDSITRNYTSQYNYAIGNYVTLQVANATGFTANTVISQPAISTKGIILSTSNTSLLVKTTAGLFVNTYPLFVSNTSTNTTINTISQGFTTSVSGLDGSNTVFALAANTYSIVSLNGMTLQTAATMPSNTSYPIYSINSTAVAFQNYTLSNSDIISIKEYTETVILSNTEFLATGTVLSSNSSVLNLINVNKYMYTGSPIYGANSGAFANVTSSSQTDILDFRTVLTCSYSIGSASLALGDMMYQGNSVFGAVASVDPASGNNYFVGLTNVKGSFSSSSNTTPQYIQSLDITKNLQVLSINTPDVVKYSGCLNYIENKVAVQRTSTQTEQIKIIIAG
jgi:hypothetical protein